MLKNYYYGLGTYVSPAIKVAQLKTRRVMCTSFGTGQGKSQGLDPFVVEDESDNNDSGRWTW